MSSGNFKAELYIDNHQAKYIRITSLISGNFSDHSVIKKDGKQLDISKLPPSEISDLISFLNSSDSASLGTSSLLSYDSFSYIGQLAPKDISHSKSEEESSFTSTGEKLSYHWPVFKKYADTGYGSIIRATVTNHQKCSSKCSYCSTIHRNNSDSISLSEFQTFIDDLTDRQVDFNRQHFPEYNALYKSVTGKDIGLQGLIFSGGGQPNLWPHFEDAVKYASSKGLDIGLITNGFPKNIDPDIYKLFSWIRISITPIEASPFYINGSFRNQPLPTSICGDDKPDSLTVGISYVYGPWTTDSVFSELSAFVKENNWDYCRLLVDCNLDRSKQLSVHQELASRLRRLGLSDSSNQVTFPFFHQLKYHGTSDEAQTLWADGQCQLQSYNVFWDTSGHDEAGFSYCYPCDSVTVLTEEGDSAKTSERQFNSHIWGTYKNTEVSKLYTNTLTQFFDPRSVCKSCLFMKNNQRVSTLTKELSSLSSEQASSRLTVNQSLKHVNFP